MAATTGNRDFESTLGQLSQFQEAARGEDLSVSINNMATAMAAANTKGSWVELSSSCSAVKALFLAVGLYFFVLLRFAKGPLFAVTKQAWRWVLPGAGFNALTNGGIAFTLGTWGNATAVNIVYSSRGLYSVLLVWLAGHWFSSTEGQVGRAVLVYRMIGAAAMVAAIGLVLI